MIIIKYPVKFSRMIYKYIQNLRGLAEKQYMQNLSVGKLSLSEMISLHIRSMSETICDTLPT